MLSGAEGATLDANSGTFTWRPAFADAAQPVPFTLKVADNGTPEMSATQQFQVQVRLPPAPTFGPPVWQNGWPAMVVRGAQGLNYTVWASTNLDDWTVLYATNPVAMPFQIIDAQAGRLPNRFYRVGFGP